MTNALVAVIVLILIINFYVHPQDAYRLVAAANRLVASVRRAWAAVRRRLPR